MPTSPGPGGWGYGSDSQGGVDIVRVKFTAGTSGAVPAFPLSCSNRVVSVAKSNTTGQYDIVFTASDYQLVGFYETILQATPATTTADNAKVVAYSSVNGTATVECRRPDTGAATYLASGDVAIFVFERQRYKSQ